MPARLVLEPHTHSGDTLEVAAALHTASATHRLWFRLPSRCAADVTTWADPFVIAFLFPLMESRQDCFIDARVSPSLLANLERFMAAWHTWCPDRYTPFALSAAEEAEPPPAPRRALSTFSCGVDSCFTAYRHARGLIGRRTQPLAAGMLMHGFDLKLDYPTGEKNFAALLAASRAMLGSLGVDTIPVTTNFRTIPSLWAHSHLTQLVAGLRLFAAGFDTGLIPNSVPYRKLATLWGSHPVSDPYLSSDTFAVLDDGADADRVDKVALIGQWPEAMAHLRVCFGTPESDHTNCCRCEKCIRTVLAIRIAGLPHPPAFSHLVTDRQVSRVKFAEPITVGYWKELVREARARNLAGASWVRAMKHALARDARRTFLNTLKRPFVPLRNALRQLFRGSAKSKRELGK